MKTFDYVLWGMFIPIKTGIQKFNTSNNAVQTQFSTLEHKKIFSAAIMNSLSLMFFLCSVRCVLVHDNPNV